MNSLHQSMVGSGLREMEHRYRVPHKNELVEDAVVELDVGKDFQLSDTLFYPRIDALMGWIWGTHFHSSPVLLAWEEAGRLTKDD